MMFPDILRRVKTLLNIEFDIDDDDILNEIIGIFYEAVALYINLEVIPVELEWIIVEATISRWNRLSSEGLQSEIVGDWSTNFIDDVLDPYYSFLDIYKRNNNISKVRFL